jgi:hypothetical protein
MPIEAPRRAADCAIGYAGSLLPGQNCNSEPRLAIQHLVVANAAIAEHNGGFDESFAYEF